jgi:ABC-type Na+ efflux pump permease subunit
MFSSSERFYNHLDVVSKKNILLKSRPESRPNNVIRPSMMMMMIMMMMIIIIIIVMAVVVMVDEIKIALV